MMRRVRPPSARVGPCRPAPMANGRNRRVSLIPVRPGECRLTEPMAAIRPWRCEPVFMPLSGPCPGLRISGSDKPYRLIYPPLHGTVG
jgi:hypothetical protein